MSDANIPDNPEDIEVNVNEVNVDESGDVEVDEVVVEDVSTEPEPEEFSDNPEGVPAAYSDKKPGVLDRIKAWDSRKKFLAIGAIAFVIGLLVVLTTCRVTVTTSQEPSNTGKGVSTLPLEGQDGDFEFSVLGLERASVAGDPTDEMLIVRPKGEFAILTFTVKNNSSQPKPYSSVPQSLVADNGETYAANTTAFSYANQGLTFLEPGKVTPVSEAFDIPAGTGITAFDAHESVMSPGVRLGIPAT